MSIGITSIKSTMEILFLFKTQQQKIIAKYNATKVRNKESYVQEASNNGSNNLIDKMDDAINIVFVI